MALPKKLTLEQLETKWPTMIDPVLDNPLVNGVILQNVSLKAGANVVNHRLGRKLQGWYPVRMRTVFTQLYDTQDTNTIPQLTLNLNSSVACVVDLAVF